MRTKTISGYKSNFFYQLFMLVYFSGTVLAQNKETPYLMNTLMREDSLTVTSMAIYPNGIRTSMLEACKQPEMLVKISTLQKKTSAEFKALLSALSRTEQEKIWRLSAYPELLKEITGDKRKNYYELEDISKRYPSELHDIIHHCEEVHYDLLVKINSMNQNNQAAFESLIAGSTAETKNALSELLKHPEAIDLLMQNMRTAVLAGDIYRKDPLLIEHKLDSVSTAYTTQHSKDLEAWKNGLESDPQVKNEMHESATEFSLYEGYTGMNETPDDLYTRNEVVVVNVIYQPYPYWFGYPWWYDYPCWYHYPWWYHCGFYQGPYGIVYIGFPSPYYTHWYFHHPHHHHHYSHFTGYYIDHYYGHRRLPSPSKREVTQWVETNRQQLPEGFFSNDAGRPERIKELGKFETDYGNAVKKNPGSKLSREDFLNSHRDKYPHLNPVSRPEKPGKINTEKPRHQQQVPVGKKPVQPRTAPVKPKQPVTPKTPGKTSVPKPVPAPKPKVNNPRGK